MTGEDLDIKPSTIEQAKFEYSPLGKIFNKGLNEDDEKGLFKMLENIKNKNKELINTINTTNKASKNKINIQSKNLIYNSKYSFVKYKGIDEFKELSLDSFYKKLNKFNNEIVNLRNISSRKEEKKELKCQVLSNTKKLYNVLYYIYKEKYNKEINSLDTNNKEWLDYKNLRLSEYLYSSEEKQEKKEQKSTKVDYKTLIKQIVDEETDINEELFKKYFSFQRPSEMLVLLNKTNDTEKNNQLVSLINSGLKVLKEEIKEMPEAEIENEDPKSVVNIVEKRTRYKSTNTKTNANRLLIALAPLNAGNN